MVVIYHSRDLDGYTSGAICKLKYPEAKLIGYDYGKPIPWEPIPEGEKVIMIDVSLPMVDMEKLATHCGKLAWIDHHKSAINDFHVYFSPRFHDFEVDKIELDYGGGGLILSNANPRYTITTKLQNGIAACEIAWQDLFAGREMPLAVKLLGEYDTWRNEDMERWNNEILPFQFGMRMLCNSPETFPTNLFDHDELCDEIIKNGKLILQYQAQINETNCRNSFEVEFEGLRAICLNGAGFNSDVFKSIYDPSKHDIMIPFQFNGNFWTVSFYSLKKEIDVSVIAKRLKGGGHRAAAGAQVLSMSTIFGKDFENIIKK